MLSQISIVSQQGQNQTTIFQQHQTIKRGKGLAHTLPLKLQIWATR